MAVVLSLPHNLVRYTCDDSVEKDGTSWDEWERRGMGLSSDTKEIDSQVRSIVREFVLRIREFDSPRLHHFYVVNSAVYNNEFSR